MFSKFKKKEKFFIMCHQRSGSNMFTSQLNGHPDVSHFGQLFKGKGDVIGKLKNMGVVEFEGVSFVDDNDERTRFDQLEKHPEKREKRNTKEFIDSFYKNYGKFAKTSRVGMKFHGGTMYQDEIEDILLNDDYKVIILYRENLVKAAISWYQARDTNKWVQVGQENKDAAEVVENFDVEEMEFFINNVKRDIA